jgi:hypothetical protein
VTFVARGNVGTSVACGTVGGRIVETERDVGVGVVIGLGVDEGAVEDWAGIVPLALVVIVAKIRLAIAVSVPGKFRVGANGVGVGIRPQATTDERKMPQTINFQEQRMRLPGSK